jgi:hypothetical protein
MKQGQNLAGNLKAVTLSCFKRQYPAFDERGRGWNRLL